MKRALALLAPVALVVGLAACGDDDDSPDATTATEETTTEATTSEAATDETKPEASTDAGGTTGDSARDLMGRLFPDLDSEQLDCVVERAGDLDPAQVATQAQEIADECGIDPADLTPDMSAISIPDLGDISIPENMDEMIQQVFPNLSDEQASCLVEQLGDDFDLARAQAVAETCDIEPADMLPG